MNLFLLSSFNSAGERFLFSPKKHGHGNKRVMNGGIHNCPKGGPKKNGGPIFLFIMAPFFFQFNI